MGTSVHVEPFWQVQAVFDPDGEGSDFAYTIGLAARGRDELHMWARPNFGDDPGADFRLSHRDLGGFLNEYAWQWLDGTLTVGDVIEKELDGGLTTIRITVGAPVHPLEVDAFGARSAQIVPLRWSLHRISVGEPVAIAESERAAWTRRIQAMEVSCVHAPSIPLAPRRGDAVSFDVDQRYGPLTSWVAVNARCILAVQRLDLLTETIIDQDRHLELGFRVSQMCAMARGAGRHEDVLRVDRLAEDVKARLSRARRWRNEAGAVADGLELPRRDVARSLERIYRTAITSILTASALEDVLPADILEPAVGWWRDVSMAPS